MRSADIIPIESNLREEVSLIWCLYENITILWQLKNFNLRPIVKTKIFNIVSSCLFRTEEAPST